MRIKKSFTQLQNRLFSRRDYLLREIQRRMQECRDSGGSRLPDLVDAASVTSGDDLTIAMAEAEVRELKQIDEALARIRSGEYGTCKNCGEPIKKERLRALPYAILCLKCKEREERFGEEEAAKGRISFGWEGIPSFEEESEEAGEKDVESYVKETEAREDYSHN